MTNVTRALAAFSINLRLSDLPDPVIHEAKRSLLHWIGCAIGGSHEASVDRALAAISSFAGPAQASVLGRSERLDLLHAAFINGISTDVLSFSDTHPETLIHPTGVVGPAILGIAEREKISGEELLVALVVGFEVASRVSHSVYPWHYNRGWHITGTAGVFGAVVAAARLMRLNEDQVTWALGIAATSAAGLRGMFGSMCKNFHSGRAAENGLLAVHLAKADFNSVEDGIGGPRCFAQVLGESPDLEKIVRDLGVTFEITKNTYKAYPCGVVIHPVIDACIEARCHAAFRVEDVLKIEIVANPYVIELTGKETPITTLEGKLSVFHSAAAALVAGRVGEQEYKPAFIARRDVIALREKVQVKVAPDMREDEAGVKLTMAGGEAIEVYVPHAKGTTDRPLEDKDIEAKFMGLCEPYLPQENIRKLVDLCWNLTTCSQAGELARLCSVAQHNK